MKWENAVLLHGVKPGIGRCPVPVEEISAGVKSSVRRNSLEETEKGRGMSVGVIAHLADHLPQSDEVPKGHGLLLGIA